MYCRWTGGLNDLAPNCRAGQAWRKNETASIIFRARSRCRMAAATRLNKSFSVIADIEVPEGGAEGKIHPWWPTGGYGIYLRCGKAHFVDNMLAIERFTIVSDTLPKGKVALAVNLTYEGKPGECW